jgi:hypothetical protein
MTTSHRTLTELAENGAAGHTLVENNSANKHRRSITTYTVTARTGEKEVQAVAVSTHHSARRGGGSYVTTRAAVTIRSEEYAVTTEYGDFMQSVKRIAQVDAGARFSVVKLLTAHADGTQVAAAFIAQLA